MRWLAILAMLVWAAPALAQKIDPRVADQTVVALQALLALREAELKALQEDMKRREADWAAYSEPLWKTPEVSSSGPAAR
jgi:hypothetical protein